MISDSGARSKFVYLRNYCRDLQEIPEVSSRPAYIKTLSLEEKVKVKGLGRDNRRDFIKRNAIKEFYSRHPISVDFTTIGLALYPILKTSSMICSTVNNLIGTHPLQDVLVGLTSSILGVSVVYKAIHLVGGDYSSPREKVNSIAFNSRILREGYKSRINGPGYEQI